MKEPKEPKEPKELKELGHNIVMLRLAKDLTQEEAAELFLLSAHHLQNIEYGYINTTVETLRHIADAFEIAPASMGVISWTDKEILEVLHSSPHLSGYSGKELDIFQNIALLRKAYGLTQRQLSELSHVSITTIRGIEHNLVNVSIATLIRIAKAFHVSLLQLAVLTTPEEKFMDMVHKAREAAQISVAA